jgi:PKHD-type hydroxylase
MNRFIFQIDTKIPEELVNLIHTSFTNSSEPWNDPMVQDPKDGEYKKLDSIRNSTHKWIADDRWECGYVWYYLHKLNLQYYGYQVNAFDSRQVQYIRYEEGQFFNWHVDEGRGTVDPLTLQRNQNLRKLSFSLQLSNSDDYEGGDLVFQDFATGEKTSATRQKGSLIVFDSRVRHKVTPVTKGTRYALVGWLVGDPWT